MSGLLGLAVGAAVVGTVLCATCGLAHRTADHSRYAKSAGRAGAAPAPGRRRQAGGRPRILDGWGDW